MEKKRMQEVIMESIELTLDTEGDEGDTLIVEPEYANTGLIRFVHDGQYTSPWYLRYAFHSEGCHFQHEANGRTPAVYIGLNYQSEQSVTDGLHKVCTFLQTGKLPS